MLVANAKVNKRLRDLVLRGVPASPDDGTIVIYSGLSVKVRGHLIEIYRNNERRVARVRVSVLPGYVADGSELHDLTTAAELMAARAQRSLGQRWTVLGWGEEEN